MTVQVANYKTIGMLRDTSESAFDSRFAFENMNMRITAKDSNTFLSLSNEKGTLDITTIGETSILGYPIGYCVMNDTLVLFTTLTLTEATNDGYDRIYAITNTSTPNTVNVVKLFEGQLNFDVTHPIETIPFYENENIQKVYWTDGKNQMRFINIKSTDTFTYKSFDYTPTLELKETISITKNNSGGTFPAGVIQYAFSYVNKYGVETNIFYTSPLYYLSDDDTGQSADQTVENSFNINLDNLDDTFNYVRIYSIIRTSVDGTPVIRKVLDIAVLDTNFSEFEPIPVEDIFSHIFAPNETIWILGSFDLNMNTYVTVEGIPNSDPTGTPISITNGWVKYTSPIITTVYDGTTFISIDNDLSLGEAIELIYFDGTTKTEILVYHQVILDNIVGDLTFGTYPASIPTSLIAFIDTNMIGETLTSTGLLYTGSEKIIVETISQKDNTLFLGNIQLVVDSVGSLEVNNSTVKDILEVNNITSITFSTKALASSMETTILNNTSHYPYESSRTLDHSDFDAKTLKCGEWYRFGILFQHETGKWSEAIWISDAYNTIQPTTTLTTVGSNFNVDIVGSKANYVLNDYTLISTLVSAGYVKARGLIVYPSLTERRVIAQGILNPTVYLIGDRATNSPSAMSSWFLRPMKPTALVSDFGDSTTASLEGGFVEFRHNRSLSGVNSAPLYVYDTLSRGAEIENFRHSNPMYNSVSYPLTPYIAPTGNADPTRATKVALIEKYSDAFIVDSSTVTFNSPEIEFDENLWNMRLDDLDLSIVGLTHLTGFISTTSVTPTDAINPGCIGFVNPFIKLFNINAVNGINVCTATPMWYDGVYLGGDRPYANFVVFPWLATRPFNNSPITLVGAPIMTSKHTSNLRFSAANTYLVNPFTFTDGITVPKLFTSNEEVVISLDAPDHSELEDYNYLANINKIILPTIGSATGFYKFATFPTSNTSTYLSNTQTGLMEWTPTLCQDNVAMKYKSAPHVVINFNWKSNGTQVILPALNGVNKAVAGELFYKEGCTESIELSDITVNTSTLGGGVWLGELTRTVNTNTIFGGKSESAFESNSWEVGGEAVSLVDSTGTALTTATIDYTAGDTYILRYDCIRTYPYSIDDVLTMTEIVSFLCETRINLDARTDKNRGKVDNRFITPLNTNLLNPIYSQKDNYFVYRGLNYDLFSLDKFPNTFTWTAKKIAGELTDTWTNIDMINTYDANGKYGSIRAIRSFNNELVGFLDKGVFKILYNSRVQVNASDGFPIEFANSGNVDGIRYISSNIGTSNKYSIVETPNGLYFIDDINKSINLINDLIINLSDKLGFRSWSKTNFTGLSPWNPVDYDNFTGHYDGINKDVYFVGETTALCFSELLGQFTSFFDYGKTPYIVNMWDGLYSIRRDTDANDTKLWKHNAGDYNRFYGALKPSYTTLIVNPNPTLNKVFNTVEFRADSWDNTTSPKSLQRVVNFTKLSVWNEYQLGNHTFVVNNGVPSNLKAKFRSWRSPVPRVTSNNYLVANGGDPMLPLNVHPTGLDRLRGNWAYMKLESDGDHNLETILHDINIYYNV